MYESQQNERLIKEFDNDKSEIVNNNEDKYSFDGENKNSPDDKTEDNRNSINDKSDENKNTWLELQPPNENIDEKDPLAKYRSLIVRFSSISDESDRMKVAVEMSGILKTENNKIDQQITNRWKDDEYRNASALIQQQLFNLIEQIQTENEITLRNIAISMAKFSVIEYPLGLWEHFFFNILNQLKRPSSHQDITRQIIYTHLTILQFLLEHNFPVLEDPSYDEKVSDIVEVLNYYMDSNDDSLLFSNYFKVTILRSIKIALSNFHKYFNGFYDFEAQMDRLILLAKSENINKFKDKNQTKKIDERISLIYDCFNVIVNNYYENINDKMQELFVISISHLRDKVDYQYSLEFWEEVAKKEKEIGIKLSKKYTLGVIPFIVEQYLLPFTTKSDPKNIGSDDPDEGTQISEEAEKCLSLISMTEPEAMFIILKQYYYEYREYSEPSKRYSALISFRIILSILDVDEVDFIEKEIMSIISFASDINEKLRYVGLNIIKLILEKFPSVIMEDNQKIIKIIPILLSNQLSHPLILAECYNIFANILKQRSQSEFMFTINSNDFDLYYNFVTQAFKSNSPDLSDAVYNYFIELIEGAPIDCNAKILQILNDYLDSTCEQMQAPSPNNIPNSNINYNDVSPNDNSLQLANINNSKMPNNNHLPTPNTKNLQSSVQNNTLVANTNNSQVLNTNSLQMVNNNNLMMPNSNYLQNANTINMQIPNNNYLQVQNSNNLQYANIGNPQMPNNNHIQIPNANNLQYANTNNPQIPINDYLQVQNVNNLQLENTGNPQMPNNNYIQIPNTNISQNSNTNNSQIPNSNFLQVPSANNLQYVNTNNLQIPNNSYLQISNANNLQSPIPNNMLLANSNNSQAPNYNILQMPNTNNLQMPTNNYLQMQNANNIQYANINNPQLPNNNYLQNSNTNNLQIANNNSHQISNNNYLQAQNTNNLQSQAPNTNMLANTNNSQLLNTNDFQMQNINNLKPSNVDLNFSYQKLYISSLPFIIKKLQSNLKAEDIDKMNKILLRLITDFDMGQEVLEVLVEIIPLISEYTGNSNYNDFVEQLIPILIDQYSLNDPLTIKWTSLALSSLFEAFPDKLKPNLEIISNILFENLTGEIVRIQHIPAIFHLFSSIIEIAAKDFTFTEILLIKIERFTPPVNILKEDIDYDLLELFYEILNTYFSLIHIFQNEKELVIKIRRKALTFLKKLERLSIIDGDLLVTAIKIIFVIFCAFKSSSFNELMQPLIRQIIEKGSIYEDEIVSSTSCRILDVLNNYN